MNADKASINLIRDRTSCKVDPCPASRELVFRVSSTYPDTRNWRFFRALICVHLSFVLIRVYLRQKNLSGLDFIELKLGDSVINSLTFPL